MIKFVFLAFNNIAVFNKSELHNVRVIQNFQDSFMINEGPSTIPYLLYLTLILCLPCLHFKKYINCMVTVRSSQIFVKKPDIRLSLEFLRAQACTFGPKICTIGTETCTLCSTTSSNIFILTFLLHLLATLVNLVLYLYVHKG